MKNFNYFKNILNKIFNGENAIIINKSHKAYSFISCEYQNCFSKSVNDNFIIPTGVKHSAKSSELDKIILKGTEGYSYFTCEYRKNALAHDSYGNIILNDNIVKIKTR